MDGHRRLRCEIESLFPLLVRYLGPQPQILDLATGPMGRASRCLRISYQRYINASWWGSPESLLKLEPPMRDRQSPRRDQRLGQATSDPRPLDRNRAVGRRLLDAVRPDHPGCRNLQDRNAAQPRPWRRAVVVLDHFIGPATRRPPGARRPVGRLVPWKESPALQLRDGFVETRETGLRLCMPFIFDDVERTHDSQSTYHRLAASSARLRRNEKEWRTVHGARELRDVDHGRAILRALDLRPIAPPPRAIARERARQR